MRDFRFAWFFSWLSWLLISGRRREGHPRLFGERDGNAAPASLGFARLRRGQVCGRRERESSPFWKIAVRVHRAGGHENMSVDIAMVALRIRMVQAHAKCRAIGVAQLKAEAAQKLCALARIEWKRSRTISSVCTPRVPHEINPGRLSAIRDLRRILQVIWRLLLITDTVFCGMLFLKLARPTNNKP